MRWPDHEPLEDGSRAPQRSVDWRTVVVGAVGALSMAALPDRFPAVQQLVLFGVVFLGLILLLATDLDQRLLPDVVTLPLVPVAAVAALTGLNPLVAGEVPLAVLAAVVFPLGLYLLSIPFGPGAIGMGDLKLLVGVGLLSGFYRTLLGLVTGALLSGLVVVVLLALRRVTLHTFIPFGPFLILGAMWGILVRL